MHEDLGLEVLQQRDTKKEKRIKRIILQTSLEVIEVTLMLVKHVQDERGTGKNAAIYVESTCTSILARTF